MGGGGAGSWGVVRGTSGAFVGVNANTMTSPASSGGALNAGSGMNFDASKYNSYYIDSAVPMVRNIPTYALIKA